MSNELIKINDQDIRLKEYKGVPVVTFRDIDEVHQRKDGTARRNFNKNRARFVEGVDFYKVCTDEIRRSNIAEISDKTTKDITFITESGYLMLCKSFTDDLSWKVQRELVNGYFRSNIIVCPVPDYKYMDKTLNGIPVITVQDICNIYNLASYKVTEFIEHRCSMPEDYTELRGRVDFVRFEEENPRYTVPTGRSVIQLLYPSGFRNLMRYLGYRYEDQKYFAAVAQKYESEEERIRAEHQQLLPDPSDVLNENETRLIEGIRTATPEDRLATKRFLIAYLKCIVEQEEKENEAIKRLYCNDRP